MIPTRANISSEHDVENMQAQQNENRKQLHSRRLITAYMLWAFRQKQKRYLDFQHMEEHEISRLLDAEWMQMTAEERKPFLDEANSSKEQHMIDHPNYKSRSRPKSVVKTVDKAVVPGRMHSSFPPTFNAQILMPNLGASTHDTETSSNFLISCIPTDLACSTTHPDSSSDSNTQCAVSGTSTSMPSHNTEILVSNLAAFLDAENRRRNFLAGCTPIYPTYSTTQPDISSDSNTQCAVKGTSTSMASHNAEIQENSSYQHRFTSLRRKNSRQELNPSDSEHSNTSSSSLFQNKLPDFQYRNQEYPLDLSVRKDP